MPVDGKGDTVETNGDPVGSTNPQAYAGAGKAGKAGDEVGGPICSFLLLPSMRPTLPS